MLLWYNGSKFLIIVEIHPRGQETVIATDECSLLWNEMLSKCIYVFILLCSKFVLYMFGV